jgi:hypothetical protein
MIGTIEMLLFSDPFHTAFDTIKILSGTRDTTHQGVTPRVHLGFQGFPPAARLDELAWPYVGRGTEDRDEIAMARTLIRRTQKSVSGLSNVTRSTRPEIGSRLLSF